MPKPSPLRRLQTFRAALDLCGEWHIIKMVNVEANESIGSPKRKDPLPELQSPKGGLLYLVLTVRLCLSTTSQSASLDKAGLRLPASAALRLRLAGRCPNSSSLFPPLAAVVAVAPSRGASGETVHFAGPYRRGYFSNRSREFVENARQKREEFVKVIKMPRRY